MSRWPWADSAAFSVRCLQWPALWQAMRSTFYFVFPDVGLQFALIAYVAVALGGFGSIFGALLAGVLIGLIESLAGLLIDPSFKVLFIFALYLAVVFMRPQGLFGRF